MLLLSWLVGGSFLANVLPVPLLLLLLLLLHQTLTGLSGGVVNCGYVLVFVGMRRSRPAQTQKIGPTLIPPLRWQWVTQRRQRNTRGDSPLHVGACQEEQSHLLGAKNTAALSSSRRFRCSGQLTDVPVGP